MQTVTSKPNRRTALKQVAAGVASFTAASKIFAQPKAPVSTSVWTFENPQLRPWMAKRIKLFTEQNPHVKVDFQSFAFGDLGKKLSVGFATGTAPDGFLSPDWLMPAWLDKNLLSPLDVTRLGFASQKAFVDDHAKAAVEGSTADGKIFGLPVWFYGFCNYVNVKHMREVGLDPARDIPKTWAQLGDNARKLTKKDGNRFSRQGFKFAMHAAPWTVIQFNPILQQVGGAWFDRSGKCAINNAAGVRAMTIRASMARQYGAEDPADSIATNPLPQLDWLKERASMFFNHPIPLQVFNSQAPQMLSEREFRAVAYPGLEAGKGYSSAYGFNLVINAKATDNEKSTLHDLYRFIMSDLNDCWADTGPFTLARRSGWTENPAVKNFPDVEEIIRAKDEGVALPRSLVYNEMADTVHRAVQRIMLSGADIQSTLNDAAAEIDRATAASKKA